MLVVLALAAGFLAVVVAARWAARRYDALGRPRPFPVWSVSLLAVLALVATGLAYRGAAQERELGRVASQLAGHKVRVDCQSTAGALVDADAHLGYVRFREDGRPATTTLIKRDQCRTLAEFDGAATADNAIAVHVLTHEAMHLRGERSESAAECQAVQRDRVTAELLGADVDEAWALAKLYWTTIYPGMPDEYRSPDCRPGGALDEGLETAPWFG